MDTTAHPTHRKEIRIGLVLYGGVSLAIYIYGVVFEFLRAVRASKGLEHNVYSAILDQTHTDITVDIVSGTSAGGINGVLLSKALCNGLSTRSFEKLRPLWLKAADFSVLLRPGRQEMAALLNENVFEEELGDGLEQMDDEAVKAEERGTTLIPAVKALDLFVTSTNLIGRILSGKELIDDLFQQPIDTKEHRKVFHLKFRTKGYNPSDQELGYNRNDLSHKENERLLRICRATSAFPVALRPVTLQKDNEVTGSLLEPGDEETVYLTDGGVLNNKPFSDSLAAISRRSAFGKVDRMLFYVEPNPETFLRQPSTSLAEPSFWDIITRTSFGIPTYQSITRDMQEIRERNERIGWFSKIVNGAEELIQNARDSHGELVAKLDEPNYRICLEAQPLFKGYQELKVNQLRYRLRDEFLASSLGLNKQNAEINSKVKQAFDDVTGELITQKKLKDFLDAFDAPYRVRRFFRLIEIIEAVYRYQNLTADDHKAIDKFLERLWALLDRANQIEWRTWDSSDAKPQGWFRESLLKLKQEIVTSDQESLKKKLRTLVESMLPPAGQDFRGLSKEFESLTREGKELALEIDDFLKNLASRSNRELAVLPSFSQIYTQFEFRDMFIYPLEILGNLGERDPIEIVRISPKDATYITSNPKNKLAGDALFHFGGFLEERWRKNDIMWGRLDAAERIIRALCRKASCTAEIEDKFIDTVLQDILKTELHEATTSPKGYQRYLREDYGVGEEGLGDLDVGKRATLGLNALLSMRDMLKYDRQPGRSNKAMQTVDKLLMQVLNYICLPLTLLVRALFSKDSLFQVVFSFIILGLGAWGAITLVLFVLGKILSINWLNIGLPIAGIALAALIFTLVFGILSMKLKSIKKPSKKKSKSP